MKIYVQIHQGRHVCILVCICVYIRSSLSIWLPLCSCTKISLNGLIASQLSVTPFYCLSQLYPNPCTYCKHLKIVVLQERRANRIDVFFFMDLRKALHNLRQNHDIMILSIDKNVVCVLPHVWYIKLKHTLTCH